MIGIDLIKTKRMSGFMERFGEKALARFLSADEISLVKNHKTASGFWAAKEAFSKAIGVGISKECSFFDIEVYKNDFGAPMLRISQRLVDAFEITSLSLSITHDGNYAIAVVAVESKKSCPIEILEKK